MPEDVDEYTPIRRYNRNRAPVYMKSKYVMQNSEGESRVIGKDVQGDNAVSFGSKEFVDLVKQMQGELGIKKDGYLGPKTVEAMAAKHPLRPEVCTSEPGNYPVMIGDKNIDMDAPVLTFLEDHRIGELPNHIRTQRVDTIVIHYDVAFYATSAVEILKNRDLSTHFCVDGDDKGSIYQCMNPSTHIAYHEERVNSTSVGIDLNNPVLPKYAEKDARNRGRERELIEGDIRGDSYEHLGYFDEQISSLAELIKALCDYFDIEPNYPDHDRVMTEDELEDFNGVLAHYHLDPDKVDPAPLDFNRLFNTNPLSRISR